MASGKAMTIGLTVVPRFFLVMTTTLLFSTPLTRLILRLKALESPTFSAVRVQLSSAAHSKHSPAATRERRNRCAGRADHLRKPTDHLIRD